MFDKETFSEILTKIHKTYNNQRDFADATGVNRTYLSQYINKKLDKPPMPKILERIAKASHGVTTYLELMFICGYINDFVSNSFTKVSSNLLPLLHKELKDNDIIANKELDDFFLTKSNSNIETVLSIYNEDEQSTIMTILNKYQDILITEMKKQAVLGKQVLNSTTTYIDEFSNNYQFYMCPVYGQISAGQPNWAEECIEGRIPIDPNLMNIINPEEHFFLRVNGESMNKVVKNGAYALIHKQDIVDDGEIAVVLVNGYNATLKKFSKQGEFVILEPMSTVTDDPEIKTQIYDKTTPIKILGKYVGKFEINK